MADSERMWDLLEGDKNVLKLDHGGAAFPIAKHI